MCGLQTSYSSLNNAHYRSDACRRGAERVRQREAIVESRIARETVFTVQGVTLDSVLEFRYLGRPISFLDDDWPAVYRNLKKARQRWAQVSRVLTQEGSSPRVCGMFYKAIVQSVLLYGCETWVITPQVLKALEGFHHRVARRLSGRMPCHVQATDAWEYLPWSKPWRKQDCIRCDTVLVFDRMHLHKGQRFVPS